MSIIQVSNLNSTINAEFGDAIVISGDSVPVKRDGFPVAVTSNGTDSAFYVSEQSTEYHIKGNKLNVIVKGSTKNYVDVREYLGMEVRSPFDYLHVEDGAGGSGGTGDSYTKAQSDAKYQPKGNYSLKGDAYTKDEADGKYQPKGNYATVTALNDKADKSTTPLKSDVYTKTESDTKYALKGEGGTPVDAYTKDESDMRYYTKNQTDTAIHNFVNDAIAPIQDFTNNVYTKDKVYTKTESDGKYALKSEISGGIKEAKNPSFILNDFKRFKPEWEVGSYYAGKSASNEIYYYDYSKAPNGSDNTDRMLRLSEMRDTAPVSPPRIRYFRHDGIAWYEVMHYGDSHITYRKPLTMNGDFRNSKEITIANPNKVIPYGIMMYRKGSRVSFNLEVQATKEITNTYTAIGTVPPEMRPQADIPIVARVIDRYNDPVKNVTLVFQVDGTILAYTTVTAAHKIICDSSYTIESHDIVDIP